MSIAILTPLISLVATVLVAIIALRGQRSISQAVIAAESQRIRERLRGEEASRAREKRRDQLIDALAELLAAVDPRVNARPDYGRAATLIHRAQLLLDLRYPNDGALNVALNHLNYQLQAYIAVAERPVEEKSLQVGRLLTAQSEVTIAARAVVHSGVDLTAT